MQISKELFDQFVTAFRDYAKQFGLLDWRVEIIQTLVTETPVEYCMDIRRRYCLLKVATELDYDVTVEDMKRLAFHEICELLVTDLEMTVNYEEIPIEERRELASKYSHALIRRLENIFFPD